MDRIAFITDMHLNEQVPINYGVDAWHNWHTILEDLAVKDIREVVIGGDIGEVSAYPSFFESLKKFNFRIILGNHDSLEDVQDFYSQHNLNHWGVEGNTPGFSSFLHENELFYAFEEDLIKYVFMDSSAGRVSDIQLEWFQKEIQCKKKIVLFIHHPILKVDTTVDHNYPLRNREILKSYLNKHQYGVVIMCGHYHTADEQVEGNIRQIITPAVSYQIKQHTMKTEPEINTFGYRILTIGQNEVNTEVIWFKSGSERDDY